MTLKDINNLEDLEFIFEALSNKKGQDILGLDLGEQSTFSDYFVLVTGQSDSHMRVLAEMAEEALEKQGRKVQLEGMSSPHWRLVDGGDVVIHVFSVKGRDFFKIDKVWGDAKALPYVYQE